MQKEEEDLILPTDEITDFGAFFKDYKAEEKFIDFLHRKIKNCEQNIYQSQAKDIVNLNNETRKLAFYSLSLNRVYFENMLFVKNGIQSKNIDKFNEVFDRCLTQCKELYDIQKIDVRAAAAEQPQDGDDISIFNLGVFEVEPEAMLYLKFIIKTHLENLFVFFPPPPTQVEEEEMVDVQRINGGSAVIPNTNKKRPHEIPDNNIFDENLTNDDGYKASNEASNNEHRRSRKRGRVVYGPVLDDEDTNSEENMLVEDYQPVLEKYDDADEGDDEEPGDLNTNIPPPLNGQNEAFHQNIASIISRCCSLNVSGINVDIDDLWDGYFVREPPATGGEKKRTHKRRNKKKKKKPSNKPKTRKRKT